jgi:hypothetical protein
MIRTEILLTDIMRSRIYETEGDCASQFLLKKLKEDLLAIHMNRYGSMFHYCPPSQPVGCPGGCQSCWDKDVDEFKRKGELPCL